MQTLSASVFNTKSQTSNVTSNSAQNVMPGFSDVGRELHDAELDAVSGGSYNASVGAAVSLVVAGAALAGAAPVIAGALVLGSIGASGVAIFRRWNNLDDES